MCAAFPADPARVGQNTDASEVNVRKSESAIVLECSAASARRSQAIGQYRCRCSCPSGQLALQIERRSATVCGQRGEGAVTTLFLWARWPKLPPPSTDFPLDDSAQWLIVRQLSGSTTMLRKALLGLAAAVLVGTTLLPDDAFAYRGGGRAGAVGVRGGGVAHRGGAVAYRGGGAYRGAAYRGAAYRGYPYRRAVGAAAVGAAAAGAAAYGAYGYYNNGYNNGCYQDAYGNMVCQQY